ncbi:F0F1 ATP synthase subunit B [Planomicrobium sp. CPCC 101079]|uniref:F0F1 ATP synthase subunit B n=1 Tax=Planomicrobium sp. CPCC 101079 TaxID=2599618 RepID=UPI0011B41992|nr:F0F1 ATP synthase subunit B [Planomicrobium sp. CPCC 101079]TWT03530.1 F0F1 ATP synthase subunit B [Planomicrobium sp. CPCC 101079]
MFFDHLALGAAESHAAEFLNTGDILATLVVFIALMLLLKKFAWGPLMGIMQEREDLIAGEIETAEKSRQESQKLLEEQRNLLKEARTQAQQIVENAKKQGEVSREDIIASARAEAGRIKESAVQEIANEREQALSAVREEVVALSMLAASRVLGKEISEEDNRQLINETIAKAGDVR